MVGFYTPVNGSAAEMTVGGRMDRVFLRDALFIPAPFERENKNINKEGGKKKKTCSVALRDKGEVP